MIVEIVPIANLQFKKTAWYTVYLNDSVLTEFEDFQKRMSENEKDEFELNEIRRFIQHIGQIHGAKPNFFKPERAAERLPPPFYIIETEDVDDFGLRLYCIRLCEEIVILLNGGRKTNRDPENCPNCSSHFRLANKLARKINEAILEGYIELDLDNKEIIIEEDFNLEI
ncbi:MAG: hypothetical protein IPQ08_09130 [Chitinophagaceae bacterium]|nr:hypothetical protein [Chitinophagaceae bacterium]